ncbi:MAG: CHAT domain-containing protein [Xanthomonadaceae bacterium]|nr:CHAT domain-containing protein [Xanthomonadaceae bacterium]
MRLFWLLLSLCWACTAGADWRDEVARLVAAGQVEIAIAVAERERASWLRPHLAQQLPAPSTYIGWVAASDDLIAYGRTPAPWARRVADGAEVVAAVAAVRTAVIAGREPPARSVGLLRALLAAVQPHLPRTGPWVFATDGALSELPFAIITDVPIVHALSERSAAVAASRAAAARRRPPTLLGFARNAADDPDALPAARAEIALAAAALGGPAELLSGPGALARLRLAAYDGTLTGARFILVATHTVQRDGMFALELADTDAAPFTPVDALHLQFTAELVVLSACETANGAGFAEAGARVGVGMTLLTLWRVDDAASAQFVAALFAELARGLRPDAAVTRVQRAFARGDHGEPYRHPYHWSGWQLWGGL